MTKVVVVRSVDQAPREYDYPTGWRPYVKIVGAGVDYTPLHVDRILAIRNNDAKVYGNCEGVLAGN